MNDVHRLQGVGGDTYCETVNFDCVQLTVPVEDLVWDDIRDLQGPTKSTLPSEDVRGGSQVPEDEGGRGGMPKCW
jgi:hypothetical protein